MQCVAHETTFKNYYHELHRYSVEHCRSKIKTFTSIYSLNFSKEDEDITREFELNVRETVERKKNVPKRYAKMSPIKQNEKKMKYNFQQSGGLYRNLVGNVQNVDEGTADPDETYKRNIKRQCLLKKHSKAKKVDEPLKWAVSEG